MLRQSNKIFIGDWAKIRIMVFNILVNIFHTFTDSEILNKCRQNTMINTSTILFRMMGHTPLNFTFI